MSADPISTATSAVSQITGVIRQAARAVGTSFSYLLATAKVESNFNPGAKATTSSAQGLFQFIEQTWLATMKDAGPRLGYGRYADAITRAPSGRMEVADPAMRAEILGLRKNPEVNAAMAGALTQQNASILQARLGRAPTEGELYIAHFLGAGGATKLINAASGNNPTGAALFPNAAQANRSVFFDKQGRARSASEVYANLTGRYEVARISATKMAGLSEDPLRKVAAAPKAAAPDPAATTQAFAAVQPPAPPQSEQGPTFHALFHTGDRPDPVGPRINQLWGQLAATAPGLAGGDASANGRPLDLFQDMPPNIGGLFGNRG